MLVIVYHASDHVPGTILFPEVPRLQAGELIYWMLEWEQECWIALGHHASDYDPLTILYPEVLVELEMKNCSLPLVLIHRIITKALPKLKRQLLPTFEKIDYWIGRDRPCIFFHCHNDKHHFYQVFYSKLTPLITKILRLIITKRYEKQIFS